MTNQVFCEVMANKATGPRNQDFRLMCHDAPLLKAFTTETPWIISIIRAVKTGWENRIETALCSGEWRSAEREAFRMCPATMPASPWAAG
jgi:hypothetical protein